MHPLKHQNNGSLTTMSGSGTSKDENKVIKYSHITSEFCPQESHYFGLHPSKRPNRADSQETENHYVEENKEDSKMTEDLKPKDDEMRKSMKILNDAYLCRHDPELDKQIEMALASVLSLGESGVEALLSRLYDGILLSNGAVQLKNWGDDTWNELLKKKEIIRAIEKVRAKSARAKLSALLSASCRTGQWSEIIVPALRSAISAIESPMTESATVPPSGPIKAEKAWWQFWK